MAVTKAELLALPTAQYVGGNVVIGERGESKIIASTVDGVFGLTDAGREYFAAQQEAEDTKVVSRTRTKKDKSAPAVPQVTDALQGLDLTQETVVQGTTSEE